MPFKVVVADNYHYMDEDENYELGTFDTLARAIEASKRIVDEFLASAYRPGMTAVELYTSYIHFGEDPYIVPSAEEARSGVLFSAWTYARERCESICGSSSEG